MIYADLSPGEGIKLQAGVRLLAVLTKGLGTGRPVADAGASFPCDARRAFSRAAAARATALTAVEAGLTGAATVAAAAAAAAACAAAKTSLVACALFAPA